MSAELSDRDPLTGLSSRRSFEELARTILERATRQKGTFALGFLDIDKFKPVNDTYGHQAGDAVITSIAREIRSVVGEAGRAARYGGEEFAILLTDTEKEQAFLLLERIRESIEKQPGGMKDGSSVPPVTVSGGVAAFPTDGRSLSEIVRKADHALYRAKSTGRNRVCIAQEERMATKTSHFTITQLERLAKLAREEGVGEAVLLREALDDLLTKYRVSDVES